MILDKYVKVAVSGNMVKYYQELGYNVKCNEVIEIPIEHLKEQSSHRVNVKCDICGFENNIIYNKYLKNTKKYNIYTCNKCKTIKVKQTNLEKYGKEYILQVPDFKEKASQTILEKYGVENISQSDIIKEKKIQTCLKNFGVEHPAQSQIVYEKRKQTNLEKYGDEHPVRLPETIMKAKKTKIEKYGDENYVNIEKIKQTNIERHGVEFPQQNLEIRQKTIDTNWEKYGVAYTFQADSVKKKIEEYFLENFGVKNASQIPLTQEKVKQTKIKNNHQKPDELLTEFELYKKKVIKVTQKEKKKLFKLWDGYDYYDGAYIKNNFSLKRYHDDYPNVDHKTSILYGFLNKLPIEIVGCIDNLCITKQKINLQKKCMIESEFLEYLKNLEPKNNL